MDGDSQSKPCKYCHTPFVPRTDKQEFCSLGCLYASPQHHFKTVGQNRYKKNMDRDRG
jgi:hypothetical protein